MSRAGRVAAAVLAAACGAPLHAGGLVGSVVPPYPDGLQEWQGSCLGATRENADPCAVSLALLGDAEARMTTIIATRLDHHDGTGHAVWQVTDVRAYPEVPAGYAFGMSNCALADVPDQALLAVVKVSDAGSWGDARWALRLDTASGRFEAVDPARVSCTNTRDEG